MWSVRGSLGARRAFGRDEWFDEEPPLKIYTGGLTRANETGGFIIATFAHCGRLP